MTLQEYNDRVYELSKRLYNDYGNEVYEKLSKFQEDYMRNVLYDYESKIDCHAKEYIRDLLQYAIDCSVSGNAIVDVPTKEIVDEIDDIIWQEIGDYLLDCEIYEDDDHWCVDVVFAGNYVPYWDGWCE